LINKPALQFKYSIHGLAIEMDPLSEGRQRPQPQIAKGAIRYYQPLNAFRQHLVGSPVSKLDGSRNGAQFMQSLGVWTGGTN
jgi:hypothetical protein